MVEGEEEAWRFFLLPFRFFAAMVRFIYLGLFFDDVIAQINRVQLYVTVPRCKAVSDGGGTVQGQQLLPLLKHSNL